MTTGLALARGRKRKTSTALVCALLAGVSLVMAPAARAAYCAAGEHLYIWGWEDGKAGRINYYTDVIASNGALEAADYVAIFAERARDQHGASPSAKPSKCFASAGAAGADLDRLKTLQGAGAQVMVDW